MAAAAAAEEEEEAATAVAVTAGADDAGPVAGEVALEAHTGVVDVPKQKVHAGSSCTEVRNFLAAQQGRDDSTKPLRRVDPANSKLEIYASTQEMMAWAPKLDYDKAAAWSKVPIFRARLYLDRATFESSPARTTVDQTFPDGVDLVSAIQWWRKRVREAGKGFAVFEGGFDTSGVVYLTDPPCIWLDAATGDCEADSFEEIERKEELHMKRRQIEARWESKGVSEELRAKIEAADLRAADRRKKGQEYMLRGGWVDKTQVGKAFDVARHNSRQKEFDCR